MSGKVAEPGATLVEDEARLTVAGDAEVELRSLHPDGRGRRMDGIGLLRAATRNEAEGATHRIDGHILRRRLAVEDERVDDELGVGADDKARFIAEAELSLAGRPGDDAVAHEDRRLDGEDAAPGGAPHSFS
jgi:hypothetical protein